MRTSHMISRWVRVALVASVLVVQVGTLLVPVSAVHAQAAASTTAAAPAPACDAGSITKVNGVYYAGGKECTPSPEQLDAAARPPQPDACAAAGWTNFSASFACFIREIYVFSFGLLITLSSWVLTIVGMWFNYLVEHIIIGFGPNVYNLIQAPLQTVWSTFRDLANILIVGMFVFIAISIILEVQEFGRKRLVVDVIIIAVLINFSLLFTKLAIDASNFVAYQFYNATLTKTAGQGSGGSATGAGTPGTAANSQVGSGSIAGQFLEYMGVSTVADTNAALEEAAKGPDIGAGSVVLHAVASSIVLLGAAAIFLYGSYLLIVRGIVIVLLLVFSSLAFASYLVPGKSRQLFSAWMSELIGTVVFAPLLMLMLWATLQMAKALKATPGSGTLGSLMSHPTANQGGNVAALFSYAVILGLLYATFYIASSLSHKAKGMSMVNAQLGLGKGLAGLTSAWALRNTVGRLAAGRQGTLGDRAKAARDEAAGAQHGSSIHTQTGNTALADFAKKYAATREKDAAKNQQASNRWGTVAGLKFGGTKSFSSVMADRTKAGEAATKKLQPSDEDKQKLREEALKNAQEQHTQQKEVLETTKQAAEKTMESVQKSADEAFQRNAKQADVITEKQIQTQHEQDAQKSEAAHKQELAKLREEAVKAEEGGDHQTAEQKKEKMREEAKNQEIARKAQSEKITAARKKVEKAQSELQAIDSKTVQVKMMKDGKEVIVPMTYAEAQKGLADATKALDEHGKVNSETLQKRANKMADEAVAATMQGIGKELGKQSGTIAERLWGGMTGDNAKVGEAVAKKFKYKKKTQGEQFKEWMKENEEGEGDKGGDKKK